MEEGIGRSLVFTRTKRGADNLVELMARKGIMAQANHPCRAIHVCVHKVLDMHIGRLLTKVLKELFPLPIGIFLWLFLHG